MRKILTIIFTLLIMATYISCSTESLDEDENLVEKTWYSTNNGNWTGSLSAFSWVFAFEECEKISDTEFQVIRETLIYFKTAMPSTSTERRISAQYAKEHCSKWNYRRITESYKKNVTTLNNGIKFYRHKIKEVKYTD